MKFMAVSGTLLHIYESFSDETRLRLVHLLAHGPLCVGHFQEILGQSQVKISKHLAYLRAKKLVQVKRHQNWMIYALPQPSSPELEAHLRCLQDCVQADPVFKNDLRLLEILLPKIRWLDAVCGT